MATYSDTQKASALAYLEACQGNIAKAARDCKVPRSTLTNWARGRHTNAEVTEICQEKKEELGDVFERLAYKAAKVVDDGLEDCSAPQAATIMGIATEKMLLLRGQANTIIDAPIGYMMYPAPEKRESHNDGE